MTVEAEQAGSPSERGAPLSRIEGTHVVFLTSAASLVVEIVAGRMLAPFVGMSLYTWTSVIAVVLSGLSVGHWIGGHLAERGAQQARGILAITLLVAAASTLAAILILPAVSASLLSRFDTAVAGITALTVSGFFIPSVAAGIPSPIIAAGLVETDPERKGRALGGLFAAGAAGSILGTLAAGYFFISWLGSTKTLIACAALYGALALLVAVRGPRGLAASVVAAVLAMSAAGYTMRTFAAFCDVESQYFCIRSVDITAETGVPSRIMILDHLAHSMSVEHDPHELLSPYIWLTDRIARAAKGDDFSAFFVGGGAYSLPRSWATRGIDVTVAEIDPAVTAMAEAEFWFNPATSTVVHQDARVALRGNDKPFDVIVGDAFTDVAVPPHLVTREFAQLIRTRLTDGGLYILHFVAPEDRLDGLLAMTRTLQTVFANVTIWFDADPASPGARRSFVFVAGNGGLPGTLANAGTWQVLDGAAIDKRIAESGIPLLTDDYAPIDRLVGMATIGIN